MSHKQQSRPEACGINNQCRNQPAGWRRADMLKGLARGGALAGLLGYGAVLVLREKKYTCAGPCGRCPEFKRGECGLGIK